jgi:hypothetical protein
MRAPNLFTEDSPMTKRSDGVHVLTELWMWKGHVLRRLIRKDLPKVQTFATRRSYSMRLEKPTPQKRFVMKKAFTASVAALLLNSVFIFAQSKPEESEKDFAAAFDASVRKTIEAVNDIPGIAIVMIKGDKPIFLRAYGMADKEAGVKADVDTLFYIASSTKAFTALTAAMLDKERKILLADPITKYTTGIMFKAPGGNGEVVGFLKGATGKFDLLKYAGRDFKRVGL